MTSFPRLTLLLALAAAAACGTSAQAAPRQGGVEVVTATVDLTPPPSSAAAPVLSSEPLPPVSAKRGSLPNGGDVRASRSTFRQTTPAGPPVVSAAADDSAAPTAPTGDGTVLVRTGTAAVQVSALGPALAGVRALAGRFGGYVSASSILSGGEQPPEASLEVRVPAARWDDAVAALAPLGKVETVNAQAADDAGERVDARARLANARRLEARLVRLLDDRAGSLADVLEVERELARARGDVERYDARLRLLSGRQAMSTLTLQLHEPRPVAADGIGDRVVRRGLGDAWSNFLDFSEGLIAALGFVVPVAVLATGGWWVARRFWHSRPESAGPTRLAIRRRPRKPNLKVE
ncbi:MAG: hypothetical protein JWM27_947 [Gemmatimonadetes bacterium]|nr:hypothetical protein [Gemmatimonadota bacterium]